MKLHDAHIAILGGSAGVGAALARGLAEQGARLSIVALPNKDLEAIAADIGATPYPVDLSDLGQLEGLIGRIEDAGGPLDALICNAAIGPSGPFQNLTAEQLRSTVVVNMLSHMELTRQALPGMVARRRGTITTTGSLSSEISLMHLGAYVPSKAGLTKWAIDLQSELRDYGIRVFTFILGAVKGTALANAAIEDPVVEFLEKRAGDAGVLTPEGVAARMIETIGSDRQSCVITIPKAAAPLVQFRHLPARLADPFVGRVGRKMKREVEAAQPGPAPTPARS